MSASKHREQMAPIPELGGVSTYELVHLARQAAHKFAGGTRTTTEAEILVGAINQACLDLESFEAHLTDGSTEHNVLLGIRERLEFFAEYGATLSKLASNPEVQP